MLRAISKTSLLLSLLGLASACGSLPNIPVCSEITLSRATCVETISGKRFDVDDQHPIVDPDTGKSYTWWDIRPATIQIPFFAYAKLKKYIVLECKQGGQCDKKVSSWDRTLESVDQIVIEK